MLCHATLFASAQDGWLPPVNFPANSFVCDTTPYKLVFFDDFLGDTLDKTQWNDFYSWAGMQPHGDHDDWAGARREGTDSTNYHCINKSENVVISNGTCKLLIKNEPANWTCATCNSPAFDSIKYYTTGVITTRYNNYDGSPNYYNSGKFEFKAKLPTLNKSHFTAWTWFGSEAWTGISGGVNEIDMVESFGNKDSTKIHYYLHAWGPKDSISILNNPYDIPDETFMEFQYPNQENNKIKNGTNLKANYWHIYTCEWDTASIKIFLDHQLINTIWKYYKTETHYYWWDLFHWLAYDVNVGSGCNPDGTYKIPKGYPWNSINSNSNFRLTTSMMKAGPITTGSIVEDSAVIDYVAIWQRHPEADNHSNICTYNNTNYPIINISSVSGLTYTLTVSNPVQGAIWEGSDNLNLISSNSNSATFQYTGDGSQYAWAKYLFDDGSTNYPSCYPFTTFKQFFVQNDFRHPSPLVVMNAVVPSTNMGQFIFACSDVTPEMGKHNTDAKYYWNIQYELGTETPGKLETYTTEGKYATTPYITIPENKKYYLEWTLKVVTPYDSVSYSGIRTSQSVMGRQENDSMYYYFTAKVDDTLAYDSLVYNRVAAVTVDPDADSIDILSLINQVRLEELIPYITLGSGSEEENKGNNGAFKHNINTELTINESHNQKASIIAPNPTSDKVQVNLSDKYELQKPLQIKILNTAGILLAEFEIPQLKNKSIELDFENFSSGLYLIELRQNTTKEHLKLVKY